MVALAAMAKEVEEAMAEEVDEATVRDLVRLRTERES